MASKSKIIPPPPRPRKKTTDEIPHVATSMKTAASVWKLPIGEIRRAKDGGCTGFVGQKVYLDGLMAWLKANPPQSPKPVGGGGDLATADKEELERLKLIGQVSRLDIGIEADKHKLAVVREDFVSKVAVTDEWARAVSIIFEEAKGLMEKDIYPVFVARVKSKIKTA